MVIIRTTWFNIQKLLLSHAEPGGNKRQKFIERLATRRTKSLLQNNRDTVRDWTLHYCYYMAYNAYDMRTGVTDELRIIVLFCISAFIRMRLHVCFEFASIVSKIVLQNMCYGWTKCIQSNKVRVYSLNKVTQPTLNT